LKTENVQKNWGSSLKILRKGGNFPAFVRQGATAEAEVAVTLARGH